MMKKEAHNPLFLKMACEELRVFGVFEKVHHCSPVLSLSLSLPPSLPPPLSVLSVQKLWHSKLLSVAYIPSY